MKAVIMHQPMPKTPLLSGRQLRNDGIVLFCGHARSESHLRKFDITARHDARKLYENVEPGDVGAEAELFRGKARKRIIITIAW